MRKLDDQCIIKDMRAWLDEKFPKNQEGFREMAPMSEVDFWLDDYYRHIGLNLEFIRSEIQKVCINALVENGNNPSDGEPVIFMFGANREDYIKARDILYQISKSGFDGVDSIMVFCKDDACTKEYYQDKYLKLLKHREKLNNVR